MSVVLETSLGDLVVDLYVKERPQCCKNFLKLCKIKYYNFCLFHSIQRNLVAQTGDPTGTGRGGSSVYEKLYGEQARFFEVEVKPRIKHTKRGTLSMVNDGSDQHGSQFFLTLADNIDYLDGTHTVFGELAEGFDTLDQLNEAICDAENRPYKDVRIYHTVILDDPFDDPDGLGQHIPDRSPEPTKEQLDSGRIGAEEEIDKTKGKTQEEIEEMLQEKEKKTNAQLLEIIGDLPSADVEAPDNVLFVCKLNPVTSSEDLEVIFSRFGNILSCEVIKDHKTGESLQYAFIEFEKPSECENAYFKMDNVLIDDRRIHVDFSQSVSKLKYQNPKDKNKFDRAQLQIKDKSKKDGYELVYSDSEQSDKKSEKKKSKKSKHSKKKKKKHQRASSDSDSDISSKSKSNLRPDRSQSPTDRKSERKIADWRNERRLPSPYQEKDKGIYDRKRRERNSRSRSPRDKGDREKQERRDRSSSPSSQKLRRDGDRNRARSRSRERSSHKLYRN